MNMSIEEKAEPVYMNMSIEEKAEPVYMNMSIEEKVENVSLHLNIVDKPEHILLSMPVIEMIQPVNINLAVEERVERVNMVINVWDSPGTGRLYDCGEAPELPSTSDIGTRALPCSTASEEETVKKQLLKSKKYCKAARLGRRMAASQLHKALGQLHSTKRMLLSLTKKISKQKFSKECLKNIVQGHVQEIATLQEELGKSHEVAQTSYKSAGDPQRKGCGDMVDSVEQRGLDLLLQDSDPTIDPDNYVEEPFEALSHAPLKRAEKENGCDREGLNCSSQGKKSSEPIESRTDTGDAALTVRKESTESKRVQNYEAADNSPSTKSGNSSVDDACWVCGCCEEGEELLLCDQCDGMFHLHCVGLGSVPTGEWLCDSCKPKQRRRGR